MIIDPKYSIGIAEMDTQHARWIQLIEKFRSVGFEQLTVNSNDAIMVKAIIGLSHDFGLDVIAEGVETPAQRDFLAAQGCHAYQGYLFSKPLPLAAFEAFAQQL